MRKKMRLCFFLLAIGILASLAALTQGQNQILIVSGRSGSVPVVQINGRNYVEVEALARMAGASLTMNGNQFTLTLSPDGQELQAATPSSSGSNPGFSSDFLRAGIEAMTSIREWHTALASAIENQFPISQAGLAPYQATAMTDLRLAQTAITTDGDRGAMQLITNVFQKMKQLSDKYVAKRANMTYIAPDSLQNDALNQNILVCGKSLGAMAASGQFVDDSSCH